MVLKKNVGSEKLSNFRIKKLIATAQVFAPLGSIPLQFCHRALICCLVGNNTRTHSNSEQRRGHICTELAEDEHIFTGETSRWLPDAT